MAGQSYLELGKNIEAIPYLGKFLEHLKIDAEFDDYTFTKLCNSTVYCLELGEIGSFLKGVSVFKTAIKYRHGNSEDYIEYLWALITYLYKSGNYIEASKYLKQYFN